MRERLIELMTDYLPHADNPLQLAYDEVVERLADHLLKNGVVVLPCRMGTRHNNLTFIAIDEEKTKEKHRTYYILRCDCGNIVSVRKDCWESGSTNNR